MRLYSQDHAGFLVEIGRAVAALAETLSSPGLYPVLGTIGDDALVEICSGPMKGRTIHRMIHIGFQAATCELIDNEITRVKLDYDPINAIATVEEPVIFLPNFPCLVAFLALLGTAFASRTGITPPQTDCGDDLDGWGEAMAASLTKGH